MRTLVVGDVHGCIDELEALLEKADLGKDDRLILAGDLVAKGPDSQAVVQLARERGALAVRGNHDAHVLSYRAGKTLKAHHLEVAKSLKEADWEYLESRPLWLDLPELNTLVVHAGLVPGIAVEHQQTHVLLNLRSLGPNLEPSTRVDGGEPWASKWPGPRFVVFGHDALRGLQRHPHALGLDTGCVYGKLLTAVWLDDRTLVSMMAKKVWRAPDEH